MPSPEVNLPPTPNRALVVDGRKFLWDGRRFDTEEAAAHELEAYQTDNFEVQLVEQGHCYLLYTRRVVKAATVTTS